MIRRTPAALQSAWNFRMAGRGSPPGTPSLGGEVGEEAAPAQVVDRRLVEELGSSRPCTTLLFPNHSGLEMISLGCAPGTTSWERRVSERVRSEPVKGVVVADEREVCGVGWVADQVEQVDRDSEPLLMDELVDRDRPEHPQERDDQPDGDTPE